MVAVPGLVVGAGLLAAGLAAQELLGHGGRSYGSSGSAVSTTASPRRRRLVLLGRLGGGHPAADDHELHVADGHGGYLRRSASGRKPSLPCPPEIARLQRPDPYPVGVAWGVGAGALHPPGDHRREQVAERQAAGGGVAGLVADRPAPRPRWAAAPPPPAGRGPGGRPARRPAGWPLWPRRSMAAAGSSYQRGSTSWAALSASSSSATRPPVARPRASAMSTSNGWLAAAGTAQVAAPRPRPSPGGPPGGRAPGPPWPG